MRGNSTYRGNEVERKGCWRCVIVSSKDLNLLIYVKYFVFQFGDLAEICENRDKIHRPKKVLFFRQSIVFIVKLDPFFIMICRKDPFCRIWNIVVLYLTKKFERVWFDLRAPAGFDKTIFYSPWFLDPS